MRNLFLFILLFCFSNLLKAQTLSDLNVFYDDIDTSKVKTLKFGFESMSFMENDSYMTEIVDGYSYTGAWLRPKLSYSFSKKLNVEFGGHFLRYHSRDDYAVVRPWFTVQYQLFDPLKVIFGSLNMNNNFGLVKQLWEPQRIITDAPREGFQLIYNTKFVDVQGWFSWEQFILPGDPFQEHFTTALSGRGLLYSNSDLNIRVPLQLMIYHQGGEIDSSPLTVVTHYNYATGIETQFNVGEGFIKTLGLNLHWMEYRCPDGPEPFNYDKGHGYSIAIEGNTRFGKVSFDYWNGFQFVAPYGRKVYWSYSDRDVTLSEETRSQIALNYVYKHPIAKGIDFSFQGEAIYDLLLTKFSYVVGFYLTIDQEFFLLKGKNL